MDRRARSFSRLCVLTCLALASATTASPSVVVNEVMFRPIAPEDSLALAFYDSLSTSPWVELRNTGPGSQSLAGWTLGNSTTELASLPAWDLPAGGLLLVVFAAGEDDSVLTDSIGVLHVPFVVPFVDTLDACALYVSTPSAAHMVDFVAWSSSEATPTGPAYAWATGTGNWPVGGVVPTKSSDSLGTSVTVLMKGESIGRDSSSTDSNDLVNFAGGGGKDAGLATPKQPNWRAAAPLLASGSLSGNAAEYDWLVMLYLDASDPKVRLSLVTAALPMIEMVRKVMNLPAVCASGLLPRMHIVVQTNDPWLMNGKGETGARYILLDSRCTADQPLTLNSPGEKWGKSALPSMVLGDTLNEFIGWAERLFPGPHQHEALIMAGHGYGWKGTMLREGGTGTNHMSMGELYGGIFGTDVETLMMISCWMGMVEVADQIPMTVKYAGLCELPSWNFPAGEFFKNIAEKNPATLTPQRFTETWAEVYGDDMLANSARTEDIAVGAVDLDAVRNVLIPQIDVLAHKLIRDVADIGELALDPADNKQLLIRASRDNAYELKFKGKIHQDWVDMSDAFLQLYTNEKLPMDTRDAAWDIVSNMNNIVTLRRKSEPKLRGLSIEWPRHQRSSNSSEFTLDNPHMGGMTPGPYRYMKNNDVTPFLNAGAHPIPPLPQFFFETNHYWSDFLNRYFEPVCVARFTRLNGDSLRPPRKSLLVFPGDVVDYTALGSSDADGDINNRYWDQDENKNSDANDWDRNGANQNTDDADKSTQNVTETVDHAGYRFLTVWNQHHVVEGGVPTHWEVGRDSIYLFMIPWRVTGGAYPTCGILPRPEPYPVVGDKPPLYWVGGWTFTGGMQGWKEEDWSGQGGRVEILPVIILPPHVPPSHMQAPVLDFVDQLTGRHVPGQDNRAVSPPMGLNPVPGYPHVGYRLSFDMFTRLPMANGFFLVWNVRSKPSPDSTGALQDAWGPWLDYGLRYYGKEDAVRRISADISPLVPLYAESLQVAIGVQDDSAKWPWLNGIEGDSPGPYVDNVQVAALAGGGPRMVARDADLLQDAFPTNGSLDLHATCRVDAVGPTIADSLGGVSVMQVVDVPCLFVRPGPPGTPPPRVRVHFRVDAGPGIDSVAFLDWLGRFPSSGGYSSASLALHNLPVTGPAAPSQFMSELSFGPMDPQYSPDSGNEVFPDSLFTPGTTLNYYFTATFVDSAGGVARLPDSTGTFTFRCLPGWADTTGPASCVLVVNAAADTSEIGTLERALAQLGVTSGWDRFDVRAADANLGNSPGSRIGQPVGSTSGPSAAQLATYKQVVWLTGRRDEAVLAAQAFGNPANDLALLQSWLTASTPDIERLWLNGSGIGLDLTRPEVAPFASAILGTNGLGSMNEVAGGVFETTCLRAFATGAPAPYDQSMFGLATQSALPGGDLVPRDVSVLDPNPGMSAAIYYEDFYMSGPFVGSVRRNPAPAATYSTLVDGFALSQLGRPGDCEVRSKAELWTAIALGNAEAPGCFGNLLSQLVDVPESGQASTFAFGPVAPNPVVASPVSFAYSLTRRGEAHLELFDVSGRLVRRLIHRELAPGRGRVAWDLCDSRGVPVAPGLYFARFSSGNDVARRTLVVLR